MQDLRLDRLEIPIRLKNVSRETIYGPVSVELNGFGIAKESLKMEETTLILNAANGKQGVGAVFDYLPALGSAESLDPGAVSAEVVWRIKLVSPGKIFDLHVTVTGFLEQRK